MDGDIPIRVSVGFALVWLAILIGCVMRFRKKGLWFLVGAPLALYWPFILLIIVVACSLNTRNCP